MHIVSAVRGQYCTVTGGGLLTSAWPPAFRSLLQRSHLRHILCQSFPRDDTFSAAHERQKTWGGETGECKHSHKAAFIYITVNNSLQFLHRLCLCMSNNVALNHSSQRGMTSLTASPSRIMISLYWGGGGILGYWECLCTTQDAVMMSLRDRQTVV